MWLPLNVLNEDGEITALPDDVYAFGDGNYRVAASYPDSTNEDIARKLTELGETAAAEKLLDTGWGRFPQELSYVGLYDPVMRTDEISTGYSQFFRLSDRFILRARIRTNGYGGEMSDGEELLEFSEKRTDMQKLITFFREYRSFYSADFGSYEISRLELICGRDGTPQKLRVIADKRNWDSILAWTVHNGYDTSVIELSETGISTGTLGYSEEITDER